MLRAYYREGDRLVAADLDVAAAPATSGNAIWYSLADPTKAEDQFVESSLGIDIPTRAEMDDIEPSARLYTEDGAEFMTITALVNSDTDEPRKTPISFMLRNQQLVTVRYADPKPFRLFERLVTIRPQAWPNSQMVGFADTLLGRKGDLTAALARHYGRQVKARPQFVAWMTELGREAELRMAV